MALTMGACGHGRRDDGVMWGMYASRRWNIAVVASAVLLGMVATFLSQSQLLVKARSWATSSVGGMGRSSSAGWRRHARGRAQLPGDSRAAARCR